MLLSLDIETYGACTANVYGKALPAQKLFNPNRSLITDGVDRKDLVLSCSLTFPGKFTSYTPRIPGGFDPFTGDHLAALYPEFTMVALMHDSKQRNALLEWLKLAKVILGQNISFDISYLRAFRDDFREVLDGSQMLVDTQILNYLHREERPEGSLKNLGPVMGLYKYDRTLKEGLFETPVTPDSKGHTLSTYNASDTHATMLLASELSRRIYADYGYNTAKMGAWSLEYFSNSLWCSIRKSEAGIPMSRTAIRILEHKWQKEVETAKDICLERWDLPLSGPGSGKAKDAFIWELIKEVNAASNGRDVAKHPLLERSKKKHKVPWSKNKEHKISWSLMNMRIMQSYLPPEHELVVVLDHVIACAKFSKLISSYTYPLLRHAKTDPDKIKDKLLYNPKFPRTQFGYPTWYITPSKFAKDDAGDRGGQQQARPSCQGPAAQTFPPVLRNAAYKSRFSLGGILVFDISQAELRVAALLSGDEYLMQAYEEGRCLHTERALQIFPNITIDHPEFQSRFRQCSKHANFSDLNLAGAYVIQKTIMKKSDIYVDIGFCREIVRARAAQRPGLTRWQNELIAQVKKDGMLVLPFTGISRRFISMSDKDKSTVVNLPIQATAATMLWRIEHYLHNKVLPLINAVNPNVYMFLNHYDALYFDCKTKKIAENILTSCEEALRYVENNDYWSWMQDLMGRKVPLAFSADFKGFPDGN